MKNIHQFQQFAKGKITQDPKSNNNAVIYTRVSSKEQADTNQSLEIQRKYCTEYGIKNNMNILGFFGGTYESAKTDERNEFSRMIKFLKNSKEKTSCILVYSLDRFSRSGENAIYISSQLKREGVTIVSVTQPIDVSTHAGVLQQNIQFIFSKYDNDLRMQKCVDGMREKLKRGEWLGAAPTGYSYDRTHGGKEQKIIINENGKVLQKAFHWRLEGHSNPQIVEKLKALGLTLPFQRISEIFRNPFYCGLISHNMLNGEIVDGKHPALVSKEVFLKVHQLNKRGGYKQKKENEHLPLKLFVKCEKCGSPFTGYIVKKKGIYYYKCNEIKCHCNRSVKIMHNNFVHLLNNKSADSTYSNVYKKALEYIYNKETSSGKTKQEVFSKQLNEIKEKLYKTEERFACGEIDRDIYNKVSEKFKSEIRAIDESIEKSNLKLSNPEKAIRFIVDLSSKLSTTWDLNDYSQKQNVQKMLFPDGLRYNIENDEYLTPRWVSPIVVTSYISSVLKEKKNGIPDNLSEISRLVARSGVEPETSGL